MWMQLMQGMHVYVQNIENLLTGLKTQTPLTWMLINGYLLIKLVHLFGLRYVGFISFLIYCSISQFKFINSIFLYCVVYIGINQDRYSLIDALKTNPEYLEFKVKVSHVHHFVTNIKEPSIYIEDLKKRYHIHVEYITKMTIRN